MENEKVMDTVEVIVPIIVVQRVLVAIQVAFRPLNLVGLNF